MKTEKPIKIILAPDSFKGSLTAEQVCLSMAEGIHKAIPHAEIVSIPMADGGEGTVRALIAAIGGRLVRQFVTGPLGEKVEAFFGILGDGKTAVIEMAAASGLTLIPEEKRNPMITTTFGTGELILAALDEGCDRLIIGLGGSATNDGGTGAAKALGYRFLDSKGRELPLGGGALMDLRKIDPSGRDKRLDHTEIIAACDVTNPLTGTEGAANVYGPQKGATPEMVEKLDLALDNLSLIVERDIKVKINSIRGAGAAGGMGAGLAAFFKGHLRPGADIVMEAVDFSERIKDSDLVITGEGSIDGQTINGKTPIAVARAAKKFDIPVLAVAGTQGNGWESVLQNGIDGVIPIINQPMNLNEAIVNAGKLVAEASEEAIRVFSAGFNAGRSFEKSKGNKDLI